MVGVAGIIHKVANRASAIRDFISTILLQMATVRREMLPKIVKHRTDMGRGQTQTKA